MKDLFTPDYMFPDFFSVTPEFLKSIGVDTLLADLDNTIAPYEMAVPDAATKDWIQYLRESGIRLILVSNNRAARVEKFNETLCLQAFPDMHKPRKRSMKKILRLAQVDLSHTAVLGDQLLTDSYSGKRLGLPSIILPPIKDKKTLFFKCKRLLERKYIKRFAKKNGFRPYLAFWNVKMQ